MRRRYDMLAFPEERLRLYAIFLAMKLGTRRSSALWDDPELFSEATGQGGDQLDEEYAAWKQAKRAFTKEEITQGKWVKIGDHGRSFVIQFRSDGTAVETHLFP